MELDKCNAAVVSFAHNGIGKPFSGKRFSYAGRALKDKILFPKKNGRQTIVFCFRHIDFF